MTVVYGALMRLHNVRYYQGVVERGTSDSSNTITLTMVTLSAAGVDIVPLNVGPAAAHLLPAPHIKY